MSKSLRQTRREGGDAGEGDIKNFWRGASIEELAAAQGVEPIQNPDELWGDFWPEDESLDAFVEAIHELRHQDVE